MKFMMKVELYILEISDIQFENLKISSTFQNAKDHDIQNTFFSVSCGCEKWLLTLIFCKQD